MNILFCHDGPVCCDKDNRYYSVGFHDKLFDRYAAIFGGVSVVMRVEQVGENSHYTESTKLSTDKYDLTEYPNYLSLKGIFSSKKESKKTLERIVSECDAMIIRLPSFLGSKCVKIARKYKKPYLIEVVGCPLDSLKNHGLSGKLLAPYLYSVTKRQVKEATDVLYVTDVFLQSRYPTRGRQIGCSDVLLDRVDLSLEKKGIKTREETLILGTAGVLDVRYKGQEFVIEALAELKKLGIRAEYRLAGSGTGNFLRERARALGVEDQVRFCGLLDRASLDLFYKELDIYVQPSLTEGMPRAVIEAMSQGCYCIGTNTGGIPELVGKEYCFAKGNTSDIVRRILAYYEDAENKNRTHCINRSKDFEAASLEIKRNKFYNDFRRFVEEGK